MKLVSCPWALDDGLTVDFGYIFVETPVVEWSFLNYPNGYFEDVTDVMAKESVQDNEPKEN